MKIGLIGAGAIAQFLLKEFDRGQVQNLKITSLLVRDVEKYKSIETKYGVKLYTNIKTFLESEVDIVVEEADINAVEDLIPTILVKKPVVLISVGALANESFLMKLSELVNEHNHPLYLPSGAIGGLDLLQNAHALGNVTRVALTTRKPASSLIDGNIQEAKVIFEGTAAEAIKKFPKNMNVSIVLALAGLGFNETNVTLVADPHIDQNIHQIEIIGDFGEMTMVVKNNPLPANPKTSYLAAMSIVGMLKRLNSQMVIGG